MHWCNCSATLIMMWDDTCPPSAESMFPGRPAASQFEHMSTFSQMAQWNLAPMISCMQLQPLEVSVLHEYHEERTLLCAVHSNMGHCCVQREGNC